MLLAGASLPLAASCDQSADWTPPPRQTFKTIEHEWIPMRDGVRLSARLWLPDGGERCPAVLECIPYRKRDLYRFLDDIWGKALAENGIAFIRLDVRGSGESEGVITDEYSEAELEDCEEAIAWIAKQSWCSGAVGMRGLSWGGINTLQVAARRPPALKAIMPMGCCDRRYTDDAHYIGGALGRTNFQWGVLFKSVMARPPDPEIVGEAWRSMWQERLEATPSILATWLQHQREDDYWKRESVAFDSSFVKGSDERTADAGVPAYLVSGWSDTYQVSVLRLLATMRAPSKALIGPWGHTYPYTAQPVGLDWAKEEVRWWRHWLNGEKTGIMDEPRLRVFMPYATASETAGRPIPGRWIAEPSWPNTPATRRYHLNAGALGDSPVAGPLIVHRNTDVVGSTKPEWLDRLPIEQSYDDTRSLVFDSAALAEPMEILGSPELRIEVASDVPVATLMARLTELRPNGESWLVTWAALNLTRRDSMTDPQPLEPGKTCTAPISLRGVAHRFGAGSKIRLTISEGSWPMLWPSPARPTLTFAVGVSTLDLPVRPMEKTPAPFAVEEINTGPAPFEAYQLAAAGPDGRVVLTTSVPSPPYRVDDTGIELSSSNEQACEIRADDPLSAQWRQAVSSTWKREALTCRVDASYELVSDANSFRITESVSAFLDGEKVFDRTNAATIPRDLM